MTALAASCQIWKSDNQTETKVYYRPIHKATTAEAGAVGWGPNGPLG